MRKGKNLKIDDAISIEDKELARQIEKQSLLFDTDALLPKPKSDETEFEKYYIYGKEYSISELKAMVEPEPRAYSPMFPNKIPFYKLMYKLLEWDKLNPNKFQKPPIVAFYTKIYIYARFDKDILPSLLIKTNPIIKGHIRKYKLFQYLNDDGLVLLEQYIKEAIKIMEISDNWHDFELKYTKIYNLSVQLKMQA